MSLKFENVWERDGKNYRLYFVLEDIFLLECEQAMSKLTMPHLSGTCPFVASMYFQISFCLLRGSYSSILDYSHYLHTFCNYWEFVSTVGSVTHHVSISSDLPSEPFWAAMAMNWRTRTLETLPGTALIAGRTGCLHGIFWCLQCLPPLPPPL